MTERLAYSVREAARALSVSPRTIYRLIDRGELDSSTVGARRVIPVAALTALLGADKEAAR